jgi:hypothetical protein
MVSQLAREGQSKKAGTSSIATRLHVVVMVVAGVCWSQTNAPTDRTCEQDACTTAQRAEVLRSWQTLVLRTFPREVDSLAPATRRGGPLEGWRLSHGHAVIAGSGAVPLDNIKMKLPLPQVLLYAPSRSSSPAEWTDFEGPDGPYRLIGWAYIGPFEPGSSPPGLPCIRDSEWVVHEAGWHLMNGGMLLTPEARVEPPRPAIEHGILMWHPQVWDIHFWIGEDGPAVSFNNPRAPNGGICLPTWAFYVFRNGLKRPVEQTPACPGRLDAPQTTDP